MKEFTVILYAGGTNRLTSDLSLPKCLLPIGNRPLIWYTIEIIRSNPFLVSAPLLILTSSSHRQIIDDYLSTLNISYEIILSRQSSESTNDDQQEIFDPLGTLDVLRCCYSRIVTESICLLTADLFGEINLTSMINMFRVRDANLILLLLPTRSSSATTSKDSFIQPGQKTKFITEPEFYTIDPSTETITSIQLKTNLDESFPFRQNILVKYPRQTIRNDLVDAHLYLIKKCSLDIAITSKYSSFRKQFLPKMIRQLVTEQSFQHFNSPIENTKVTNRHKTTDFDDHEHFSKVLQDYDSENGKVHGGCYYSIAETQLFRVKHVLSFLEANRQAASLISSLTNEDITSKNRIEQVQISQDCVIDDGCEIGKKTTIKRTIIGKYCRIEEKCKIVNCVLLDNVQIKEGTILQNSILCSRSTIGTKCEIINSIVCSNQQVETNKKVNGETIAPVNNETDHFMLYDEEQ